MRDIRQNRGAHIESAAEILALTARSDFGAFAQRVVEVVVNDRCLPLGDEGANLAAIGIGIIEFNPFSFFHQSLDESVVHFLLHINALNGKADLARAGDSAAEHRRRGLLQIRGLRDDHRIFAAQFENRGNKSLRACFRDFSAVGNAAREIYDVHVVDDCLSGFAIAHDEYEHFGKLGRFKNRFHHGLHKSRRDLARLDDHRAAGKERGNRVQASKA